MPLRADFFDRRALYAYYCAPMTDTLIPDYVDARKIFVQQALIEGTLPVAALPRLGELLADTSGMVNLSLRFSIDDEYRRVIDGSLSSKIAVICQRCLEPMQVEIDESFTLALVESEEQAEKLPKRLDPWLCEDVKLPLADIVEEQLILCMPIVNHHAHDCIGSLTFEDSHHSKNASNTGDEKGNPFNILKTLKDKH